MFVSGEIEERLVLTQLEVAVISADDAVSIVNSDGSDIGESLDFGSTFLALRICQVKVELLSTRLDSVPASQS